MATVATGTEDLLADLDQGVLRLTLNRPDARNAMTAAMNAALASHLATAELNRRRRPGRAGMAVALAALSRRMGEGLGVRAMRPPFALERLEQSSDGQLVYVPTGCPLPYRHVIRRRPH